MCILVGKSVNFQRVVMGNSMFLTLLGFCSFFAELTLLHLLRYSRTISVLAATLLKSSRDLIQILILFFVAFIAYCGFFYLMYGPQLADFGSLLDTMSTMLTASLASFDFYAATSVGGSLAGLLLLSYVLLMALLIINLLVVILCDFMAAMQADREQFKDAEVIDYLQDSVMALVKKNKPKTEEKTGKTCLIFVGW